MQRDNISDDDIVRNFLIVALVTFLCSNSNVYPSTEYLKPLIDVKKAKGWDWSKFVHYWLFKQIKKYNTLKKEPDHATIAMGGCMYIVCLLPLKSTCYHKHSGSTTPSPTCINDGVIFKKKLTDTVEGNMSQETLDGVTALYMKHAAGQNGSASENAQNIIVDVINYFYQRAQLDKRSGSSQVNDQSSTPDAAPDAGANIDNNTKNDNTAICEMYDNVTTTEGHSPDYAHVDGNVDTAGPQGQRSGDTELAPSSGGDCNSLPNSVTETVKVSRSFNCTPEHFDSSQVYFEKKECKATGFTSR
ncbi:hypothetical protein C2845_PM11G01480 [Panicum miliaceum]|uniref:Uncharacterized protein n=1 Tax=Panicum miliaceum TaxID=4540 RepID=A0A3L6RTJ5_PANMI|nr:hypothetical protein C2845_PM11G01480 [Panicum miliaceum]